MPTKLKHYNPSRGSHKASWRVFDADGRVLGRLASEIATALMGKDRPSYVPHLVSGDFVVVVNASKIAVTGDKAEQKVYLRHSQYPGNLKKISYERMSAKMPERIIELAVKGMLPKNKLGSKLMTRLKVYAGQEHPHMAQVIGSERAATYVEPDMSDIVLQEVVEQVAPEAVEETVEQAVPDVLSTSIDDLEMNARAKSALKSHGLSTVGDIVDLGRARLSTDVRGFGARSMEDLENVIDDLGVELGN